MKKEKEKKQSPEEQLRAAHYNHMMYGPTAGELGSTPKKINYGTSYLKHPKFQALMTAFRSGTGYKFNVTDKDKVHVISTDQSHIFFDGKILYYCRPLNRHEHNLLLDRTLLIQYQPNEALVHLAFAVILYFPELGTPRLSYIRDQFYYGTETLESAVAEQGPNLMIGAYKNVKAQGKSGK